MPLGPVFVAGDLGVGLLVAMNQERSGRFVLDLNLLDADLTIPQLDWQKSAKVKSAAKITAEFDAERLTRIASFDLAGGGVKLTGDAVFSKNAVETVNIQKFLLGRSDVSGLVARRDGGWSVSVRGPRLDISALLDHEDEAAQLKELGPDLNVKLEVGRLEVSDGNYLRNVSGNLKITGGYGRSWMRLPRWMAENHWLLTCPLSAGNGVVDRSRGCRSGSKKSRLLREHRRRQARNKGRIRRHDPGQHCYRSGAD